MPATITWDDVQADFDALQETGLYSPLDAAMEPIQKLIGQDEYSPEMVKYFIEQISEMNDAFVTVIAKTKDDTTQKRLIRKAVQQVEARFKEAQFKQEKWKVGNVNNAQVMFNFVFAPIKKEVEEPDPSIKIPIVLLVMNQKEARELDSGKITVTMPANYMKEFNGFKDLLKPDWLKTYGSSPEKWKPFGSINSDIDELMSEMLLKVQQTKEYQKPLVPYFISVHALRTDRRVLNYLRLNGCFVVNDVISMWHPEIQRSYRASLLDAFPSTIVFRIAPLNQNDQALSSAQPVISFLEQFQDLEFFKRIDSDSDLKCKDLWMSTEFKQLVMNFTPALIPPYDKVNSPLTGRIIGGKTR